MTEAPTERQMPAGQHPRARPAGRPLRVMEPPSGGIAVDWREVWRYRELLYFFTWRDVKIRYKQTLLGAAWAVLQPLISMVVFTIFFGKLAGLEARTGGVPYPVYVFAGLLPWTFFANAVGSSAGSLIGGSSLVTKVYFPRLVLPLSAVGAGLIDLAVSFVVLLAMMAGYRVELSWQLALLPVFLAGTVAAAAGAGSLLAALSVSYRDFRYVVPFVLQVWMFVTPVIYPSGLVPEPWRWVLALNPMSGLIEGFRGALLARPIDGPQTAVSLAVSAAFFLAGAAWFRRMEQGFADVI